MLAALAGDIPLLTKIFANMPAEIDFDENTKFYIEERLIFCLNFSRKVHQAMNFRVYFKNKKEDAFVVHHKVWSAKIKKAIINEELPKLSKPVATQATLKQENLIPVTRLMSPSISQPSQAINAVMEPERTQTEIEKFDAEPSVTTNQSSALTPELPLAVTRSSAQTRQPTLSSLALLNRLLASSVIPKPFGRLLGDLAQRYFNQSIVPVPVVNTPHTTVPAIADTPPAFNNTNLLAALVQQNGITDERQRPEVNAEVMQKDVDAMNDAINSRKINAILRKIYTHEWIMSRLSVNYKPDTIADILEILHLKQDNAEKLQAVQARVTKSLNNHGLFSYLFRSHDTTKQYEAIQKIAAPAA